MNEVLAEVRHGAAIPPGMDALLEKGYAALGRKEVETALSYFAQVLAIEPERVDLLNDCGGICGLLRRYEEAVGFFQQALRVQPERADVLNNLGLTLGMIGRHHEAAGYLSRAVEAQPDYFDALCNLGHSLNHTGRHREALECLDRAVGIRSGHAGALCNRGVALAGLDRHAEALQAFNEALRVDARHVNTLVGGACSLLCLGRADEALEWTDRALRLEPGHTAALGYRGTALLRLERTAEGEQCFERALQLSPARARTLHDQARALQNMGRRADALERADRALALSPDLLDAVLTRGGILLELDRVEDALACFDQILVSSPKNLSALNNRAVALTRLHKHVLALITLDEALAVQPDDYHTLVNRGVTLGKLLRWEESLASYENALRVRPASFEALVNRAATLFNMFRLEEARECLDTILQRDPENHEALTTMGAILWHYNRNAEARVHLERALQLKPGHVNAINNLSFIDLAEGDLVKGFLGQEIRWQTEIFSRVSRTDSARLWLGKESLQGRTIFLQHEQGFGDTLQFIRYARLLAERGARVILGAPRPLRDLLAGVAGVSAVITEGDPVPAHDFQCPLMSLPVAFATALDTIPGGVPYIHADPERAAEWRERLGPAHRPRIGLVWAGRQFPPINVPRDMSLALLRPLFELDADLVSLQKDVPSADRGLLDSLAPGKLSRLGEAVGDFSDTAALIESLDLIIAVDTAIVHLAGAMGKRTWIMNRFGSCWRWLRDGRNNSPWYPTVCLFRQRSLGDWEGVVRDVKQAAEQFVAAWTRTPAADLPRAPASNASLMRRAAVHARQGAVAEAIDCYREVLAADPENLTALSALGLQLGQIGYHAQALACFDKALTSSPASFELLSNRGAALTALGQEAEALICLDRALSLDEGNVAARCNRGVALLRLGQPRQALACFDEVLQTDPGQVDARVSRGRAQLTLGNLRDGFRELENRWTVPALRGKALKTLAPLWLGKESLEGKTILLYQDQDVASAILLARYIPLVAALAGRVLLAFSAHLRALLRSSFVALSSVQVLPDSPEFPSHDYHCPVMSLPHAFDTQLETIPAQVPYLRPDVRRVQTWCARLGLRGQRLQVGLAWREPGDVRNGRGLELCHLLPLLEFSADFVILQPDCTEAERALLERFAGVQRADEAFGDAADVAALLENLDLVISTDVAVAHLAGALGKPVFVALAPAASWCWMQERRESPWYPSATLFRQSGERPWSTVAAELTAAIDDLANDWASARGGATASAGVTAGSAAAHPANGAGGDSVAAVSGPAAAATGEIAVALLMRGTELHGRRDYDGAQACFEQVLIAEPDHITALAWAGQTLGHLDRPAEALHALDRLLARSPRHTKGQQLRAQTLAELGRTEEALECCDRLLAQHPDDVAALSTRAQVLNRLQRTGEALLSADHALLLDAQAVAARLNRCESLVALDCPQEALACIDDVLRIEPEHVGALVQRGVVLTRLERLEEALACLDAALLLRPAHPDALYARSAIHLARGNLRQGFTDRESRWAASLTDIQELASPAPRWLGESPVEGQRVLIHAEPELGDTLQYCRYVPLLAARGARVVLRVPRTLQLLMRSLPCQLQLASDDEPLPPHDLHCPLPSLPVAFGTTLSSIPASIPYLKADPGRLAYWKRRLEPYPAPRLGIVWAGYPAPVSVSRDIPLALLLPLLQLDASFVSLQKEVPQAEGMLARSLSRLIPYGAELTDLADCAALLANLDLVISTDTAVAHLAGAMGKPVWVLNRYSPSWRWLRVRDDSPWYPSALLFRQKAFGDWGSVIHYVEQAARGFIAGYCARARRQ